MAKFPKIECIVRSLKSARMANLLDWTSGKDTRDTVHIIVQALVEGNLVALPAETAYHVFASGLKPEAVSGLDELSSRGKVGKGSIFLRSPQEALDYSPVMSRVAARVVNRGWPGPLVLELPVDSPNSLAAQLPESVRRTLVSENRFLAQRVAAHEVILEAMKLLPGPLVAAPIIDTQSELEQAPTTPNRRSADGAVCSGQEAGRYLEEDVTFVVDDGVTHYGGLATSVRIEENRCTQLIDGVIERDVLDQLFHLIVLLVCTGNTCRSPMAEVMLKELLQQRFPHLMDRERPAAYVASAGLSAFPGGPASVEAQTVMKKRGLSLHAHQSRSLTERSLRHADVVLTMTGSHRSAILEKMPNLGDKIQLLSGSNQDVSDPFGGSESVYSACSEQINGYLQRWMDQVEESWFPNWQSKIG